MIILDTNVLSEMMRPAPHPAVHRWLAAQRRTELFTTTISQAEISFGIAALAEGRRRDALAAAAEALFTEDLRGRVLPFDAAAAARYGGITADRRRAGKPLEGFDGLIAAIAAATGAHVATRDVGDFEGCGVTLIDPWQYG